jgi:hypothetical protein
MLRIVLVRNPAANLDRLGMTLSPNNPLALLGSSYAIFPNSNREAARRLIQPATIRPHLRITRRGASGRYEERSGYYSRPCEKGS